MIIELRHLRCFLAIAEESSVTRAAAGLHLTQPAVSRTLAALEEHLGTRLVDRSTHHLALTAEGEVFRDKAAAAGGRCGWATPGPPSGRTPRPCSAAGSRNTRTPRWNSCGSTTARRA